ncbi:unnamed protein product, partial [Oppiella nova]
MTFEGTSRTKQRARHEAARHAIQYFSQTVPLLPEPTLLAPHDSRFRNRYDHYHRYQPYYRSHAIRDIPFHRRADVQPYSRPPLGPQEPQPSGGDDRPVGQTVEAVEPKADANRRLTDDFTADDFTADDYTADDFVEFCDNKIDEQLEEMFTSEDTSEQHVTNRKERIILRVTGDSPANQNPVSLIHELQPNAKWVCTELNTGRSHSSSFEMRLLLPLANECFTGVGRTKKLAKCEAASKALLQMYNISLSPPNDTASGHIQHRNTVHIAQEPLVLKQDIADRIGRQVMTKCSEIWDKLVELKKWTVLSAIVLTDETNAEFVDVICMTSGTKCVKGDSLSMNGSALNDCHAEVLSRRAFVSYIYGQIESLVDNNFEDKPELIVERRVDGFGFRLKKHIKVNLFISTAPCGDSRVFSPKEEEGDAHPNRQTRGLL